MYSPRAQFTTSFDFLKEDRGGQKEWRPRGREEIPAEESATNSNTYIPRSCCPIWTKSFTLTKTNFLKILFWRGPNLVQFPSSRFVYGFFKKKLGNASIWFMVSHTFQFFYNLLHTPFLLYGFLILKLWNFHLVKSNSMQKFISVPK